MIQIKIARREIQLPLYRIHFEIAKFFAKIQNFSPYKYFVFFIKIICRIKFIYFLGKKIQHFQGKSYKFAMASLSFIFHFFNVHSPQFR